MSFKNDSSPNQVSAELWQSLKSPRYDNLLPCQVLAQLSDNFLLEPKQEHEANRPREHAGTSVGDNRDPATATATKMKMKTKTKQSFSCKENTGLAISSSSANTYNSSDSGLGVNNNGAVFVANK
ncbi:hypothetical protein H0G86_007226 [Trichoderma simmonsii]|uniref:Uncharacterized protein n=1 Tax=Trichoderma simmonsii TaxID=1491479 RepID=A0A8G0PG50_9HYPO|nr:hypothetical protein H0G86_007226 [Trichoderma simmonsii]